MKRFFVQLLRRFGLLSFDLVVIRSENYPSAKSVSPGVVVLVENSGVQKWACLRCPKGCDGLISLSLAPNRRPKWEVTTDFWERPTISPSIRQQVQCRCHFWVKAGLVEWCADSI
jgi:hypothetical protein